MINEINYIKIKKNYICFLYISLFSLFSFNFVYIIPFSMGLDQSAYWIYNISNIKHWIYGKDLFYTFGPLGYMVYPMNIGSNLFYTTITFIFIYTYGVYLTYKIININFKNNFSISIVFLAIFSFILGSNLIYNIREYFIIYIFLLSITYIYITKNIIEQRINFIFSNILLIIMSYMKFSGVIIMFGTMIIFLLLNLLLNNKNCKYYFIILFSTIIFFIISFYAYSGSLDYVKNYIYYAVKISDSYNLALSVVSNTKHYIYVIIVVCLFFISMIVNYRNKKIFYYLFMLSIPAFFTYKHAFVRSDAPHISIFYHGLFLYLNLIFLCIGSNYKIKKIRIFPYIIIFIICISLLNLNINSIFNELKMRYNILKDYSRLKEYSLDKNALLSESFLKEIGQKKVTVYGLDVSIGLYNNLNFKPMPLILPLMAYDSELDSINSKIFDEKYFDYIIVSNSTIDWRLPFIESPRTFNKIINNYSAIKFDVDRKLILLKRNEHTVNGIIKTKVAGKVKFNKDIIIPSSHYNSLKIFIKKSIFGKVAKFIYKNTDILLEAYNSKGDIIYKGRILPESFDNEEGIPIKVNLYDSMSVMKYINQDLSDKEISKIKIYGPGSKFYKDEIRYELFEYDRRINNNLNIEFNIKNISKNVNFDYTLNDKSCKYSIDKIEKRGSYIFISGWAIDSINPNKKSNVYIKIGNKIFNTESIDRKDVIDYYGINAVNGINYGFEAYININEINLSDLISLIVISGEDNTGNLINIRKLSDLI